MLFRSVPATAGVLSALGLLTSEVGCDASRSVVRRLSTIGVEEVRGVVGELRAQGADVLLGQGIEEPEMRFAVSADLRYAGQSHELNVSLPGMEAGERPFDALIGAFHAEHETRFGHSDPAEEIELVTLRVRVVGPPSLPDVPCFAADEAFDARRVLARFGGVGSVETRVLSRDSLGEGAALEGPAIVVGSDATLLVPPGVAGRCDRAGTILLEVR